MFMILYSNLQSSNFPNIEIGINLLLVSFLISHNIFDTTIYGKH